MALLKLYYPFDHQMLRVLIWGDIPGALSLSESMLRKLLVGATYLVVICSTIVQGLSIELLMEKLGLHIGTAAAAGKY